MFNRIILIVLDSVGIGELPDASVFSDVGASTIQNIAKAVNGLNMPNMEKMGLGRIEKIVGIDPMKARQGCFGKMAELSPCKDTIVGLWEIAGCIIDKPFPCYPNGFPKEVIQSFMRETGLEDILGNKMASGTDIITELGEEHIRIGYPIVYTSADSVFQIAAHEKIIPLKRLYELCKIAREKVMIGDHACGRVIARPFIGESGSFERTVNRHDYSLKPVTKTMLEILKEHNYMTIGIGKISDIFASVGISESFLTKGNDDSINKLLKIMKNKKGKGLLFANLVDFDMLFGHRRNPKKYAQALEKFDNSLNNVFQQLNNNDLLIITADHGCDPTFKGSDHTREYVPLLAYHNNVSLQNLGIRNTFSDVSATILENFRLPSLNKGKSFFKLVI